MLDNIRYSIGVQNIDVYANVNILDVISKKDVDVDATHPG